MQTVEAWVRRTGEQLRWVEPALKAPAAQSDIDHKLMCTWHPENGGRMDFAQRSDARLRRLAVTTVAILCLLTMLIGAGCKPRETASSEPPAAASSDESGAVAPGNDYSALTSAWMVNGWRRSQDAGFRDVPPDFSPDGKYVITPFPAVFDASTGEKLWEGTAQDMTPDGEGMDVTSVTIRTPLGDFVLHTPELLAQGEADSREVAGEYDRLLSVALQQGETADAANGLRRVVRDPHDSNRAYVLVGGIYAAPNAGSQNKLPSEQPYAAGLFDYESAQFIWTRRFPDPNPYLKVFLEDDKVLVEQLSGSEMRWLIQDGTASDIDATPTGPDPNPTFRYRTVTAVATDPDSNSDMVWGWGVDASGELRAFQGPVPGLPDSYIDADSGNKPTAPYDVDFLSISPDGMLVLFELGGGGGAGWGVATIQ